jgi:phosphoribosylglycinamide formyltransferase-1
VTSRPRIAVLCSGGGSNLGALFAACDRGDLEVEIALVIANNGDAPALERARVRGVEAMHLSSKTHANVDEALCAVMAERSIDAVVLAGYMKRIGPGLIARYPNRIFNIHPALLPRFGGPGMYGMHVHQAVLAAGESVSGATVHLVDNEYDHGEVLGQSEVPVLADDTAQSLAARVLAAEHDLYAKVLQRELVERPRANHIA